MFRVRQMKYITKPDFDMRVLTTLFVSQDEESARDFMQHWADTAEYEADLLLYKGWKQIDEDYCGQGDRHKTETFGYEEPDLTGLEDDEDDPRLRELEEAA